MRLFSKISLLKTAVLFLLFSICGVSVNAAKNIKGLTVIVDFADCKLEYSDIEIHDLLNKRNGYRKFDNLGSIREYYLIQSAGKIDIQSEVVRVVLPANSFDYYNKEGYDGGQRLMHDVVSELNKSFPKGFAGLTLDNKNAIKYFQVLMSTPKRAGVAYGVHKPLYLLNNGKRVMVKSVARSSFGSESPNITTLCHEIGHHVFGWPDYYVVSDKTSNLGHYCMMGSGGDKKNPMQTNPGLRISQGWYKKIVELNDVKSVNLKLKAGDLSTIYLFRNRNNPKEYFVFEYLKHTSFYLPKTNDGYVPDQGLAIWHVVEGSNPNEPYVRLIQANGVDEMNDKQCTHRQKRGDGNDLYKDNVESISYATNRILSWKDGSTSEFIISKLNFVKDKVSFLFDANHN